MDDISEVQHIVHRSQTTSYLRNKFSEILSPAATFSLKFDDMVHHQNNGLLYTFGSQFLTQPYVRTVVPTIPAAAVMPDFSSMNMSYVV